MESPLPAPPPGHDAEALLADIRACHGGFNVPGFWRELAAGCAPDDAAELAKILSFSAVVIPTMVLEIECLRHALALGAGGGSGGREQ